MTAKEIAAATEVSLRTVQRLARELFPNKIINRQKATFSHEETERLLISLRKKGVVYLRQNVAALRQNVAGPKLPAGNQMHELRMIYGPAEAAKRLDFVIDYKRPMALPFPESEKAPAAVAADGFRSLLAVAEKGPAQQELNLGAEK